MKDLLKIFKYLRIFQQIAFWDPLEFTTPTGNAPKRVQKWVPKSNSAQIMKKVQKVDFRGVFFTGRLEQILFAEAFENGPKSGFLKNPELSVCNRGRAN